MKRLYVLAILIASLAGHVKVAQAAGIYTAPVVIPGFKIRHAARYPIGSYRLFKTDNKGRAEAIPFQIDEINAYGDFVLDQGGPVTKNDGNGIFDLQDELSFMGDDVGPVVPPTVWPGQKPYAVFEISQVFRGTGTNGPRTGAVYLAVFLNQAPPLSSRNYVVFNPQQGKVETSRYVYNFDQLNYLVVNGVQMKNRTNAGSPYPLISSSTFYMKADLKYFLTFEVFHKDIQSSLEAFKIGPIRAIVRVSFFYRFLKVNFELGMYTEVSLFSNSVILPAIMYNPLNGDKSLNAGSGFYYGFAISENPNSYKIESNIPTYQPPTNTNLLSFFNKDPVVESTYWLSITGKDKMMYFEVVPSKEMLDKKNIPSLYREPIAADDLSKARPNDKAKALGKSPVNLALYFDLAKFNEGEHRISFKLFFDNIFDDNEMQQFKTLNYWETLHQRL